MVVAMQRALLLHDNVLSLADKFASLSGIICILEFLFQLCFEFDILLSPAQASACYQINTLSLPWTIMYCLILIGFYSLVPNKFIVFSTLKLLAYAAKSRFFNRLYN
jgi:hypothetical protein